MARPIIRSGYWYKKEHVKIIKNLGVQSRNIQVRIGSHHINQFGNINNKHIQIKIHKIVSLKSLI